MLIPGGSSVLTRTVRFRPSQHTVPMKWGVLRAGPSRSSLCAQAGSTTSQKNITNFYLVHTFSHAKMTEMHAYTLQKIFTVMGHLCAYYTKLFAKKTKQTCTIHACSVYSFMQESEKAQLILTYNLFHIFLAVRARKCTQYGQIWGLVEAKISVLCMSVSFSLQKFCIVSCQNVS